ncbi:hypothetical protein H5410_030842 [Solanum commersonii]|uniref:Uncharacterized protein n=1 Tax=Solanum commersonii TaxID=4109 RepID=A0A9J5YIK2_SOLCO|nr:hypothetical protein H5410_030842 [Solanum commersonii]
MNFCKLSAYVDVCGSMDICLGVLWESDATLTLKKRNTMHVFTHRLALIFQSIFDSAHSRSESRSRTFMFVRLRALFKSSVLIEIET